MCLADKKTGENLRFDGLGKNDDSLQPDYQISVNLKANSGTLRGPWISYKSSFSPLFKG